MSDQMSTYLRNIAITFCLLCILPGVVVAPMLFMAMESGKGILVGFFTCFLAAIPAMLIILLYDMACRYRNYKTYGQLNLKIKQNLSFKIEKKDEFRILDAAKAILKSDRFTLVSSGEKFVEFKTKSKYSKDRDKIRVELYHKTDKSIMAILISEPINPFALFDHGRNFKNISIIMVTLKESFSSIQNAVAI